jgi:hypothetical protein
VQGCGYGSIRMERRNSESNAVAPEAVAGLTETSILICTCDPALASSATIAHTSAEFMASAYDRCAKQGQQLILLFHRRPLPQPVVPEGDQNKMTGLPPAGRLASIR